MAETPWERERRERREREEAEGLTYFTGRCNCYRGHYSNSGRCRVDGGFRTLPERKGICNGCWESCGHREEHATIG